MIYFDNAATSWPKPSSVIDAVTNCMKKFAANPGRSGHRMALKASEAVYECRELVARFFGVEDESNVIFTFNATHGLNMIISGILRPGDHAICTQMDHNSVLRPLFTLKPDVEISIASADPDGYVSPESVISLIKPNTKLIIMTHVSNVCGSIMPVWEIAKEAKKNNIIFALDASQSAGIFGINMKDSGIDFLACPGHKGLLGPMGTGLLCINCSHNLKPLIYGGTGSYSHSLIQPAELPDSLESGTLNLPGICGLCEGIKYVKSIGTQNIKNHELSLTSFLIGEISNMKKYKIIGKKTIEGRSSVISVIHSEKSSSQVAGELGNVYNIAVRAMFHCAYEAHRALGTSDFGTVRISPGPFSTLSEIKTLLYALEHI